MIAERTCVTANVTRDAVEAAKPILKQEGLTMGEYLRLCVAYLIEHGKPPFEVPKTSRGLTKRKAALRDSVGKTFFG